MSGGGKRDCGFLLLFFHLRRKKKRGGRNSAVLIHHAAPGSKKSLSFLRGGEGVGPRKAVEFIKGE